MNYIMAGDLCLCARTCVCLLLMVVRADDTEKERSGGWMMFMVPISKCRKIESEGVKVNFALKA